MFFLNPDILIKQIIPPNWRYVPNSVNESGKYLFLKSISKPFNWILNSLIEFRSNTKTKINLTAEVIILENKLKEITGLTYGIYISDTITANIFEVHIPISAQIYRIEIQEFLNKVIPTGRIYSIIYY